MEFHPDGCIVSNIAWQEFAVMFEPNCPHAKLQGATIIVQAESAESALAYGKKWINLPQMHAVAATPA